MAKPLAHVDTEAREPFIIIDGKKYPTSGAFKPPSFSFAANYSNNFNGTVRVQAPYRPPEGYSFQTFCLVSSGFTQVSTCNYERDENIINCRIYQGGSNQTRALELIGWRLVSLSTNPNRLQ